MVDIAQTRSVSGLGGARATHTQNIGIRDMIAAVSAGVGQRVLAVLGDSTEAGYGLTLQDSAPYLLAAILTAAGVPARADGFFGIGNIGTKTWAALLAYNTKITGGTGTWNVDANSVNWPGGGYIGTGSSVAQFALTPDKAADRLTILTGLGGGTFKVYDSDGTTVLATLTCDGTKKTVTRGAASTNSFKFERTTGTAYIASVLPWNSTVPELLIANCSGAGFKVENFITGSDGLSTPAQLTVLDPDVCYIEVGLNDASAPTGVPTFTTSLISLITARRAAGAAIIVGTQQVTSNTTTYPAYAQASRDVALSQGAALLDMEAALGAYASIPAAWWQGDGLHPTKLGAAVKAGLIAKALLA